MSRKRKVWRYQKGPSEAVNRIEQGQTIQWLKEKRKKKQWSTKLSTEN